MAKLEIRLRVFRFSVILMTVTVLGTVGFMIIERWPITDAFYMTVITLSTVGFSEVRPLSPAGRLFTSALIVAGVAAVMYLFGAVSQYIISGELTGSLRARRMQQLIDKLKDHYIICGYGRVGRRAALDLIRRNRQCVVVDQDPDVVSPDDEELFFIDGDVTEDATLERAGIERAAGLVAVTGDDATNLFVTLSAHAMRPELHVVARVNDPANEAKLSRAGATHVVSPYAISGRRIAAQLLNPAVADFLDTVLHTENLELWLEECTIAEGSDLAKQTVAESQVRNRTGVNVLALRQASDGRLLSNPPPDMHLNAGDTLLALGTRDQLRDLARIAGDKITLSEA